MKRAAQSRSGELGGTQLMRGSTGASMQSITTDRLVVTTVVRCAAQQVVSCMDWQRWRTILERVAAPVGLVGRRLARRWERIGQLIGRPDPQM